MMSMVLLSLFFLSLIAIPCVFSACIGNVSLTEYQALTELFESTNGLHWKSATGWRSPNDVPFYNSPCAKVPWYGLGCIASGRYHCSISSLALTKNLLYGTIPTSIGYFTGMLSINLGSNSLYGSLPTEFGLLKNLTGLTMSSNSFDGTLPTEIGHLSKMSTFDLNTNHLEGSIPESFTSLLALQFFILRVNYLTGTIPEGMWSLKRLFFMSLNTNYLNGTISSNIGTAVNQLYLDHNLFTGTIPTTFGYLTMLNYIRFSYNELIGPLPTQFGSMVYLWSLELQNNRIDGTIPTELGNLNETYQIYLSNNDLVGTIPSELSKISKLYLLDFQSNSLGGTIPTEFGRLTMLFALYFNDNYLSQTLPTELFQIPYLLSIDISYNHFTGPFPAFLLDCPFLAGITLTGNQFSGLLPTGFRLANRSSLVQVLAGSNHFSGPIPWEFIHLPLLRVLILSNNKLSGSLDGLFNLSISKIADEKAENNGALVSYSESSSSVMTRFQFLCLDFTKNYLTGTIPADMFSNSPNLVSAALSQNCFQGSLPLTICDPVNLTDLVLDGLSSSQDCQMTMPSDYIFRGKFAGRLMSGPIPSCIWSLPSLAQLHVAGNGFTGTIPNVPISQSLVEVSVANNYLSGTIPDELQSAMSHCQYFDLSVNKFTGVLNGSVTMPVGSHLNLTVNRLSGLIPVSLVTAENIAILDGNLFECRQSTKPENDPSSDGYVCGSYDFAIAVTTWTCTIIVLVMVMATLLVYINSSGHMLLKKSSPSGDGISTVDLSNGAPSELRSDTDSRESLAYFPKKPGFSPIQLGLQWWEVSTLLTTYHAIFRSPYSALFLDLMFLCIKICSVLGCFYIFLAMFFYIGVKWFLQEKYSTYYDQYGWTATAAMMHGLLPAVAVATFALFALIAIGFMLCVFATMFPTKYYSKPRMHRRQFGLLKQILQPTKSLKYRCRFLITIMVRGITMVWRVLLQIFLQLVNLLIVSTINGLYVQAILAKNPYLSYIQVALSIFKAVWGRFYNGVVARSLIGHLGSTVFIRNSALVNIFNMILAPCLVTALTDSRCFSSVVTGQDEFETSYSVYIQYFSPIQAWLSARMEFSVSIAPVFLYSYQCGSALILNYVPVLLYSYLISSFLLPPVMLGLSLLSVTNRWKSHCIVRMLVSKIGILNVKSIRAEIEEDMEKARRERPTDSYVPKNAVGMADIEHHSQNIDAPESVEDESIQSESLLSESSARISGRSSSKTIEQFEVDDDDGYASYMLGATEFERNWLQKQKKMFFAEQLVATLLQHLTVMLTFGLACPLLAVAVVLTACIELVLIQMMMGRFASLSMELVDASLLYRVDERVIGRTVALMEARVAGAGNAFLNSFWLLAIVTGIFWGVMVFDMIADVYSLRAGMLALIIVAGGLPVLAILIYTLVITITRRRYKKSSLRIRFDTKGSSMDKNLVVPLVESLVEGTENRPSAILTTSGHPDSSDPLLWSSETKSAIVEELECETL